MSAIETGMSGFTLGTLGMWVQGEHMSGLDAVLPLMVGERPMSHWANLSWESDAPHTSGGIAICFGYAGLKEGHAFPVPLFASALLPIVKQWLAQIDYRKDVYNRNAHGDGKSSPGWRAMCGDGLPVDLNYRHGVSVAVQPVWNYYGK